MKKIFLAIVLFAPSIAGAQGKKSTADLSSIRSPKPSKLLTTPPQAIVQSEMAPKDKAALQLKVQVVKNKPSLKEEMKPLIPQAPQTPGGNN